MTMNGDTRVVTELTRIHDQPKKTRKTTLYSILAHLFLFCRFLCAVTYMEELKCDLANMSYGEPVMFSVLFLFAIFYF